MRCCVIHAGPRSFFVLASTRTWAPAVGPVALRVVVATEYFMGGLPDSCQGAPRLVPCTALRDAAEQIRQALRPVLCQVETIDSFGEPQVSVNARDDDPGVDCQNFDSHEGDPDIDIDDQSLVEDEVDNFG